jgi:hypothetical protein
MRKLAAVLLLLSSFAFAKGGRVSSHSSHSSHPHTSHSHVSKSQKTVHVRGYTRKDGTYVAPYDRRAPGTATTTSASTNYSSIHPYRKNYVAEGFTAHPTVQRDRHGKIKRSKTARSAFMHEHPCPSTGKTNGRCPGYVVDHVNALECGGADASYNMQWQATADAKAKDKTERNCRL